MAAKLPVITFILTLQVAAQLVAGAPGRLERQSVSPGGGWPKTACPSGSFSHMIAFGDSTSDTGNAVRSGEAAIYSEALRPPYGGGYFDGKPTGRFSDGRLMVDLLAQALGHQLLPPHQELVQAAAAPSSTPQSSNMIVSQNFAVAGATALAGPTLNRLANGARSTTPYSLDVQVSMFLKETEAAGKIDAEKHSALVYVGEIGGNDYNYFYGTQAPHPDPEKVLGLVPAVVDEVERQLDRLLSGAPFVKHVVVQGQFPMGCISLYLNQLAGNSNFSLDSHGCIESVNMVTNTHDRLLRQAIRRLQFKHRHASFVFFDTTAAYFHILDHAAGYGFTDTVKPCFSALIDVLEHGRKTHAEPASDVAPAPAAAAAASSSNNAEVPAKLAGACPDPSVFMSWDGIHLTEAMHRALVQHFLYDGSRYMQTYSGNFLAPCA